MRSLASHAHRSFGVPLALALVVACATSRRGLGDGEAEGAPPPLSNPPVGSLGDKDAGPTSKSDDPDQDPTSCEEAKTRKSYVGCDYWPTVTPNTIQPLFDYAVVVANVGASDASVHVTGPNAVNKQLTVPAGSLKKIYLPWVADLKASLAVNPATLIVKGGAYHLVSSSPVVVYQFNPLEYKGEGGEEPNGDPKDWSKCTDTSGQGCYAFSADASLLLPSTAMTGNYRITGMTGFDASTPTQVGLKVPAVVSITATAAATTVSVQLSKTGAVRAGKAGNGITEMTVEGGGKVTLTLENAGDVAQLVTKGEEEFDFSGSVVQADKPIQVIASTPCIFLPRDVLACDHIEETVLPAETLGKHYVLATPTGAQGKAANQLVRFYGNRDGTTLTYSPSKPEGCPDTLAAGDVMECGLVEDSFEVTGDQEFGVATFLLGANSYFDSASMGDPSQTTHPSVEQYRTKYVFLAPNDYPVQWADVTATENATIALDGQASAAPWTKIGAGPYGIRRLDLTKSGQDGAHVLTASERVEVQVIGYGKYTSFQYPAGLNLKPIAPPPEPK